MEVWEGEHDAIDSERYMRRSLQLDPDFLVSRVTLWHSMVSQARYQEADEILRPLEEPAALGRLTPYERAIARFMRGFLDGSWAVQLAAIREAARLVPTPWTLYRWGVTERRARRPHAALEALSRIRPGDTPAELGPQTGHYLHYRAMVHHQLGHYDEELEDVLLGQRHYPADGWSYVDEVGALVGLGRLTELEAVIARAERAALRSGSVGAVLFRASRELDVHGHPEAARAMAVRAAAWYASRAGTVTPTTVFRRAHADALLNGGDCKRGVASWRDLALEAPDNLLYRGNYATARLVCGGDRYEARRTVDALAKQDRPGVHGLHLFQSARILAALGDADAAVRALHASFARGWGFGHDDLHADYAWMPILHHPGFQAWLNPKE
jgi:tetratricopeptide (TPR) repeat protein